VGTACGATDHKDVGEGRVFLVKPDLSINAAGSLTGLQGGQTYSQPLEGWDCELDPSGNVADKDGYRVIVWTCQTAEQGLLNRGREPRYHVPGCAGLKRVGILEPNGVPVTDNHRKFGAGFPGVCSISPTGSAGLPGDDAGLVWRLVPEPAWTPTPTVQWRDPAGNTGPTPVVDITGLPADNGEFGPRNLELDHPLGFWTDEQEIELFFERDAWNHPPEVVLPPEPTPNWYYYWSQTSASYGAHVYEPSIPDPCGWYEWRNGAWRALIGPAANETEPRQGYEGIDCFARICRHEAQHVADMTAWWLGQQIEGWNDLDDDHMPDNQEHLITPGYISGNPRTYGEIDAEDHCEREMADWTEGAADAEDWANPGHQWTK